MTTTIAGSVEFLGKRGTITELTLEGTWKRQHVNYVVQYNTATIAALII